MHREDRQFKGILEMVDMVAKAQIDQRKAEKEASWVFFGPP